MADSGDGDAVREPCAAPGPYAAPDPYAAPGPYPAPLPPPAPNSANRPHYLTHPAYGGYPGLPGDRGRPAPRAPLAHPVWLPARPGNGFGTAALVVGIVGVLLGVAVVPGIVLGVLAMVFGAVGRTRRARGQATNGGTALAGMVLGGTAVTVSALVAALLALAHP
ncbi:DUF4190 domain-containing protein [Streptomyces chattanoogensis]|uniref:DUF4190 domain-containing protein n=1 Tax=Streptomyces chattanoogensis TaxID=66876 RepID=UPI00369CBED7